MNRPFYAFGVLIAFLVLAMLAISVSSRPAGKQPSAGASGLPRRQPGVTTYVIVLPEDSPATALDGLLEFCADEAANPSALCGLTSRPSGHTLGCDPGSAVSMCGDVYIKPTLWSCGWSCTEEIRTNSGLQFVSIRAALPPRLDALDAPLATGYDAAYDRAMAEGVSAYRARLQSRDAAEEASGVETDTGEELVLLFDSLARCESLHREQELNLSQLGVRRWDFELRTIVLGTANRLWQVAIVTKLDDDWLAAREQPGLASRAKARSLPGPTWADYTAWIGSKQWTVALHRGQIRTTALFWNLPHSELLQFAVAGLNRVAELLPELAAQWLNQAADRLREQAAVPPAWLGQK